MKAKRKPRSNRVASDDGLDCIFSGDYSVGMWAAINALDAISTGDQVGDVLYLVCCRLQEFETRINKMRSNAAVHRRGPDSNE